MAVLLKEKRKLVCINSPPVTDAWASYTTYLSRLLGSPSTYFDIHAPAAEDWNDVSAEVVGLEPELVVWQEPVLTWLQRPFRRWIVRRMINRLPGSVLLVQQPHWPLHRLLLVVRADGHDEPAVAWTERLAAQSGAAVTILPVVPSLPGLYQHGTRVQPPLEVLLSPATFSGAYLQAYARRLGQLGIEGNICQRVGAPNWQIRSEMAQGGYDLVLIAEESTSRALRWLLGELVTPLLGWLKRPLLLARPVV
jgi:nucleotide-binding universal stress UspA family protein